MDKTLFEVGKVVEEIMDSSRVRYWYAVHEAEQQTLGGFDGLVEKTPRKVPMGQGHLFDTQRGMTLCQFVLQKEVKIKGHSTKRSVPVSGLPLCEVCLKEFTRDPSFRESARLQAWREGRPLDVSVDFN